MDIDYASLGIGFLLATFLPFIDIISVAIIRRTMSNRDRKEERVGD